MHFLLVNKNSAVKKIFNITAKKAGIELDTVDSIEKIPLDKDYGCIFVDDEVLKTGNVGDFKSKMITTKFCIILSKDSPLVSGFDSYIRKPFLPTDIYDVLKKEKYNEMNNAIDEGDNDENLGEVGSAEGDINANSDIDLSEFSDSEDEFLSGAKEADEAQNIDFGGNPMGGSADLNLNDLPSDSISNESPEPSASDSGATNDNSTSEDFEIPTTFDLDSVDLGHLSDLGNSTADLANPAVNANDSADLGANLGTQNAEFDLNTPSNLDANPATDSLDSLPYPASASPTQGINNAPLDLDSIDLNANPAQDLGIEPDIGIADLAQPQSLKAEQKPQSEILEETESQGNIDALADTGNSANAQDDIDFSQIMALQDEILKEEKEKKKKSVIGGDIYTPKGDEVNPAPNDATQMPQTPQMPEPNIAPLDIAPQTPAPQPTLQTDDFADIMPNPADTANPAPALDNIAPDNLTPSPANPADLIDLDLGIDLQNTDSNTDSIDLAQDSVQNITQDSTIDLQTPDIALQDSTPQTPQEISQDAIDLAPSADSIDLAQDLPQGADLSSIDSGIDSQNPMQDAQGAEEDFLESLDFLKDPAPVQSADSADLIDLSSMDSTTQDSAPQDSLSIDANTLDSMPPPAPPPLDLTQDMPPKSAQPEKKQNYEEYSFDSMVDSMADELFDGLDNLKGISDIADDSLTPPKPKHSGNNDILNNLEITPQNLDADYHADSATSGAIADTAQGANPANADEDANNFNSAFSSGISAEMDSISPNFKSQDFIQDLTLGSDTTLPDFSKSLKQHTTPEQRYNMLGLPIDESGDVKNINDLSKNELENLDDEAILLLQEKSLQEPKKPTKPNKEAPKVLDKQQIDDITNILEGTQKPKSTPNQSTQKPQKPTVEISNNEFDSLTQEALSEVLGEEALDFESSADFISAPNNAPSNSNPAPTATNPSLNQSVNINVNPPQNTPNIGTAIPTLDEPTLPKQINLADGNIDIAELLQTFPIDKLRELLSGVQITVNITFPTKKQN